MTRQPRWRGPGEVDYGFPPWSPTGDVLAHARELGRALGRLVLAPVDAARLRRRLRARSGPVLVSLGSGALAEPDWFCLDLVRRPPSVFLADLRGRLPFPDSSVDGLLAEHCLEHLPFDDVARVLAECARVLRPGRPLRIVAPDARFIAKLITSPDDADASGYVAFDHRIHRWDTDPLAPWRTLNRLSHQWGQHQALLAPEPLRHMLADAGFTDQVTTAFDRTVYFDTVPGSHTGRFEVNTEAFALECRRAVDGSAASPVAAVTAETRRT